MVFYFCLGYQLWNSQTFKYCHQSAGVWVSPQSLPFSQYILSAYFESRLLVYRAHHVDSSILEIIFFRSSHLRSSMVYQTSWLLEPGPSVLCIPLQRGSPMPLFGSELYLFGMFLNHMYMGGYLWIFETQGIVFVWKKHAFFLKGQFLPGLWKGLRHRTYDPLTHHVLHLSAFSERWSHILKQLGHNSLDYLYPRGISYSSNDFPVRYWSFLEASSQKFFTKD